MSDVREFFERILPKAMDANQIGYDAWYPRVLTDAILAALEENGMAVVKCEGWMTAEEREYWKAVTLDMHAEAKKAIEARARPAGTVKEG